MKVKSKAYIYFVPEHYSVRCGCTIPAAWVGHVETTGRRSFEHAVPDQPYGDTAEEAVQNLRAAWPEIKTVVIEEGGEHD